MEPSERALVLISSLTPAGKAKLKTLYRGLGTVSVELADLMGYLDRWVGLRARVATAAGAGVCELPVNRDHRPSRAAPPLVAWRPKGRLAITPSAAWGSTTWPTPGLIRIRRVSSLGRCPTTGARRASGSS